MRKRMDFLSMHCLRRIDIRYRLINSFILVSLLPLLVSGIIAYQQTSQATQDKTRLYSVQVVKQISQNLELRMAQIKTFSDELALSDALQTRDVDFGNESSLFIVDKSGNVIVPGQTLDDINDADDVADPALMQGIADSRAQQHGSDFISYTGHDGKPYYAAIARVPHTSWMVVSATPGDHMNADSLSVRNKMIDIGLLCFLVSLLLSYLISRSISLPLQQLVSAMKETESGNSRIRMRPHGSDELAILSVKFNDMASKIHRNKEQLEEQVAERTRELENANRKLEALSATDGLTGIANRRRFDEALAGELRRSARAGTPLSLLMLDIDHFKKYNDRYGHLAGDQCLRIIARILSQSSRRATDLVARYGGEEFAVILAESDTASALQQAENICNAISAARIAHADSPFAYVTASIGLATVRAGDTMPPDELLRVADQALYQAKRQGRHQAVPAIDKRSRALLRDVA